MVIGIFCKKIDMFVRVGSIPARLIKISISVPSFVRTDTFD